MYDWSRWPPRGWESPTPRAQFAIFTAIAGYISAALIGIGLTPVIAGVVANLAIGAALLGISTIVSGGAQRPTTSTPQAQATLNQSTGPRIRGYGRAKLGGTRAFWDSRNGALHQIVMAHHGQIDAFEQFFVGDISVSRNDLGYVTNGPFSPSPGISYVLIQAQDGSPGQLANGVMLTDWPGIWTTEHRLRGIANWMVRFGSPAPEDYQAIFPEGYNTPVTCMCRLTRVWDPRTGITAWSDNASLCILDYLTHADGYGRSIEDIDVPSFSAFADVCDQYVPLSNGGGELRYRLWGIYGLTDDPQDVLGKMRATCDAEFYQTAEGKIAIRGGVWAPPTVTIRANDILGHSMEQGNNRFAAFNELKIIYTSSNHDFQSMEATSWENLEDQAERGVLSSALTLDMVPTATQARRLAKIHIAKANPQWKGTIVANLSALNALGERTIRLVLPELEIDDAFFVAGFSIRPDLAGVEISVMSIREAAYTWSTAEEGASPPIPEDTRPDLTFPVPLNVTLSQSAKVITAVVDDPGRSDLALHGQVRAGAGSLWQEMSTSGLSASFGPVAPAVTTIYQVRARWRGPLETSGAWSDIEDISISP